MKIQNLKIGDRLQFSKNTFACVGRSEVDISLLKGTVENLSHSLDGNHVWVKLDIPHKEFEGDEWGNCVQFNSDMYSSGGTSFEYLQRARKIENETF